MTPEPAVGARAPDGSAAAEFGEIPARRAIARLPMALWRATVGVTERAELQFDVRGHLIVAVANDPAPSDTKKRYVGFASISPDTLT